MEEGSSVMAGPLSTRPSLLIRLRDPQDDESWRQFVALYGPMIYQFGRQCRLQDADAADLTQVVLQAVMGEMGRLDYDPARGSFKGWLFTLARNHLHKLRARESDRVRATADPRVQQLLANQAAPPDDENELWEFEHRRQLFRWAAQRVRERVEETSWQAFWLTAVDGRAAGKAADELGMRVGAVYTAKSRVLGVCPSIAFRKRGSNNRVADGTWSPGLARLFDE